MSVPKTQTQWTIGEMGTFDALTLSSSAPVPEVGDNDVLVKRDIFLDLSHSPMTLTHHRSAVHAA